jgi:uncharacterized membrane protein YheB (UPF0754 family)
MNVELEDAIGDSPVVTAGGEPAEGKTIYVTLVSAVVATMLGLIGWIIKNRTSSQRVEDAANQLTVESLGSARDRIKELESQLRDSLNREIANSQAQIAASSAAQRAAIQAEHAERLVEAIQRTAEAARKEADATRALLTRAVAYYKELRALMITAGLTPPSEPEL